MVSMKLKEEWMAAMKVKCFMLQDMIVRNNGLQTPRGKSTNSFHITHHSRTGWLQ